MNERHKKRSERLVHMAYCITVCMQKGGVGKTTLTINLAACMAKQGKKVLIVDTDQQGDLTSTATEYSISTGHFAKKGVYDMIHAHDIADASNYISHTQYENIDIISSNANTPLVPGLIEMSATASNGTINKYEMLALCLCEISDNYDIILIDTPPNQGLLVQNALYASDSVLIPIHSTYYSLQGLGEMLRLFFELEKAAETEINVLGIVLSMVKNRVAMNDWLQENIDEKIRDNALFKHFNIDDKKFFKSTISNNQAIVEGEIMGPAIFNVSDKKKSAGAKKKKETGVNKAASEYMSLCNEILDKISEEG